MLAWGSGLTLFGITLIVCAVTFLRDYKGIAARYSESVLKSRMKMPVVGRYAQTSSTSSVRVSIGVGFILFGFVVLLIGILGLSKA